jgi:hypothetical protein
MEAGREESSRRIGRGERRVLKKGLYAVATLAIILILLIWGAVQYMKPDQALDLQYEEVPVTGKMLDILKNRKPEVQLTEQDINNLVKKQLSPQQTVLPNNVTLTGAKFLLHGDQVEADVNLLWNHQVAVAAKLFFQLSWNSPNLEITHTSTQIKQFPVSRAWFHLNPIRIPLTENLPKLIAIKDVIFDPNAIRIQLMLK